LQAKLNAIALHEQPFGIETVTKDIHGLLYSAYMQEKVFKPIGVDNGNCVGYDNTSLVYKFANNQLSGDYALRGVDICGAWGLHLSAMDLTRTLSYLKYTELLLSNNMKQQMNSLLLGWGENWGIGLGHQGDIGMGSGAELHTCFGNFERNGERVEVSIIMNSERPADLFGDQCDFLNQAFGNSWQ